jgi:dihydroneopterin aldolase
MKPREGMPDLEQDEWVGHEPRDERALFIRDLVVPVEIGAYEREVGRLQKLRFDLRVTLGPPFDWHDRLDDVLDYDVLRQGILDIVAGGHIHLLETLAEGIVALCFSHAQVQGVHLRIAKLEAHADCTVGYETRRRR